MSKSDGDTGSRKSAMGEAWQARALMEKFGFKSVEEMEKALAAGPVSPTDLQMAVSEPGVAVVDNDQEDPLAGITHETRFVEFISGTSSFVLRQRNHRMQPPMERVVLKSYRVGPWAACPFHIGDRNDHVKDQNIKVFKSNWHHLRLSRETAIEMYGDDRIPRPTTHVLAPSEFSGWDRHGHRAKGTHTEIEEFVPLREATRYLLQKAQETFLNYAVRDFDFDVRIPNPYRNKITNVTVEMKP